MIRTISLGLIALLLAGQVGMAIASNSADLRAVWFSAKQTSQEKTKTYQSAVAKYAGDKSDPNRQAMVDTGKDLLSAALNEVEAWLKWKDAEAGENPELTATLKSEISADVQTNLGKIANLRADVAGITNQIQLGTVFIKMVGKYTELVTDVARNWGKALIVLGNKFVGTAKDFEAKLRVAAEGMPDNSAIIAKLDAAKADLAEAQSNVNKAEAAYIKVKLPGTPLIKFAEANNYLNTARTNLLSAQANLQQAYTLMVGR